MDHKSNWSQFLIRDDRKVLAKIQSSGFSKSVVTDLVRSHVFAAIRSLHFSRSNRIGVDVPKDSLMFLSEQFIKWLHDKDEWSKLDELWSKDKNGPWSMPFFIHRSYYRFRRETFPQGVKGEVSFSGQRSYLELDGSFAGLTAPILEAFSFVTQAIPEPFRLYYQLHLEGLLNHEIAAVLNCDVKIVREKIAQAKEFLEDEDTRAQVG